MVGSVQKHFLLAIACLVIASGMTFIASARANSGELDADFGKGGKLLLDHSLSSAGTPADLEQHGDGLLMVIRGYWSLGGGGTALRMKNDGSIDRSFGSDGNLNPGNAGSIIAVAAAPDGRIAAIAQSRPPMTEYSNSVLAFRTNGSPDTSFGNQGRVDLAQFAIGFEPTAVRFLPDGRLFVAGSSGANVTATIARLNANGSLDTSFGTNGFAISTEPPTGRYGLRTGFAASPTGSALFGLGAIRPSASGTSSVTGIQKFDEFGQLDGAFGTGGRIEISEMQHASVRGITEIALSKSGAVGVIQDSSNLDCSTPCREANRARFFSANGNPTQDSRTSGPVSIAATKNDEFVIAHQGSDLAEMAVARVMATGAPVQDFALDGFARAAIGARSFPYEVAVQRDSKVVVAGLTCPNHRNCRIALARFLGEEGGRAAPQPRINSTTWSSQGRRSLRTVAGTAGPKQGLRSVAVAILLTKQTGKRTPGCNWLTKPGGRFRRLAKRDGQCRRPILMRARGLTKWKLKFARQLPAGRYRLYVRATATNGSFNPLNEDADSFRDFRVQR